MQDKSQQIVREQRIEECLIWLWYMVNLRLGFENGTLRCVFC